MRDKLMKNESITDAMLVEQIEASGALVTQLDLEIYAHARLRVLQGRPLKPAQRRHLTRLLALVARLAEVTHVPKP